MNNYTNKLRSLRKEKGYTLKSLAEQSGIPLSSIAAFETGKRVMNIGSREELCRILQIDVEDLDVKIELDPRTQLLNSPTLNNERSLSGFREKTIEAFIETATTLKDWGALRMLSEELRMRELRHERDSKKIKENP